MGCTQATSKVTIDLHSALTDVQCMFCRCMCVCASVFACVCMCARLHASMHVCGRELHVRLYAGSGLNCRGKKRS